MKIYLAGPLFSEAERNWDAMLKEQIESQASALGKEVDVVWPYQFITAEEIERLGGEAHREIFRRCMTALLDTDIVVANLDGTQVDDGTAWEIGFFFRNKSENSKIIGIRTDFRSAGDFSHSVVNLMIECSCDHVVRSAEELMEVLGGVLVGR